MAKRYGLILPGQKSEPIQQPKANFSRPSIFDESESSSDNDDDDEVDKKRNPPPIRAGSSRISMEPGNAEKRQARKLQEKALKEDPTVFQYDELYDELESKRDEEKKLKKNEIKKPRYINRLLECAERRKIEYERRIERLAQKEREEEGDQFKDKDSFVTSSYRKKLEELKKAEEREKREDYLEAIGDVTKQQDLGGFYRHLYEQKLGPKNLTTKLNAPTPTTSENVEKVDKILKTSKSRAYRKRHASDEDDDDDDNNKGEIPQKNNIKGKKAHLQSNLDADSDFSIDSSSESDQEEIKSKDNLELCKTNETEEISIKQEIPTEKPEEEIKQNSSEKPSTSKNDSKDLKLLENIKIEKDESENVNNNEEKKKLKKDNIWKKRTIGEVFEAALQRYCERKAARCG